MAIASLTCNCVSENADVSINVFALRGKEIEKERVHDLDCEIGIEINSRLVNVKYLKSLDMVLNVEDEIIQ